MSSVVAATRPGTVTFVVTLAWITALLSIVAGVTLLLASDQAVSDAGIAASTATTLGWTEIVWGVVVALIASGLGRGSNAARLIVTILALVRVGLSILGALALNGIQAVWLVGMTGLLALILLGLLWNARASEFFARN